MKKEDEEGKYGYMRSYAKYFSLTFQMVVLIVLGGFGGRALDSYFQLPSHLFTIILIILAAIIAFYLFFKTIFSK